MTTPRKRAFQRTAPTGWKPNQGDQVFLPPRKPFGKSARGTVEAPSLLPDVLTVCYRVHGYIKRARLILGDLRPLPIPKPRKRKRARHAERKTND